MLLNSASIAWTHRASGALFRNSSLVLGHLLLHGCRLQHRHRRTCSSKDNHTHCVDTKLTWKLWLFGLTTNDVRLKSIFNDPVVAQTTVFPETTLSKWEMAIYLILCIVSPALICICVCACLYHVDPCPLRNYCAVLSCHPVRVKWGGSCLQNLCYKPVWCEAHHTAVMWRP